MANMRAMALIMIPLMILVGVGTLYNNLNANGFATTADSSTCTSLNCPAYTATGCVQAIANCTLSATTNFSFLNPNSPFTYLMSFDVVGFVSSFANNPSNQPSSNIGDTTLCITYANNGDKKDGIMGFLCDAVTWLNQKQFYSGNPPLQPVALSICQTYNSSWTLGGCYVLSTTQQPTAGGWGNTCNNAANGTEIFSNWVLTGNVTDPSTGGTTNQQGQIMFFGDYCDSDNPAYVDFSLTQFIVATPNLGSSGSAPVLGFFGFIAGILLLIGGLAITFGGSLFSTGFNFGIGDQGAKLMQVLGIATMAFSFIFSEFSFWLFNGTLGFGIGAIVTTVIGAVYFSGVLWLSQSYF